MCVEQQCNFNFLHIPLCHFSFVIILGYKKVALCAFYFYFYFYFYNYTVRCTLVSADYSQIEMRILAHLCKDPVLLDLFRHEQDYDIYRQLAGRIFSRPVPTVTEEERTKAKVICLGEVSTSTASSRFSIQDFYVVRSLYKMLC